MQDRLAVQSSVNAQVIKISGNFLKTNTVHYISLVIMMRITVIKRPTGKIAEPHSEAGGAVCGAGHETSGWFGFSGDKGVRSGLVGTLGSLAVLVSIEQR